MRTPRFSACIPVGTPLGLMRATILSFAVAAITFASPLAAQNRADLVGVVFDNTTQEPLLGVLVEINGTGFRALTDTAGVFRIRNVAPGEYTFSFRKLGYISGESRILTVPGEPLFVALIPQPVVLDGLNVQVNRLESRLRSLPYSAVELTELDLRMSGGSDVWSVLRNRMGFYETPCFSELGSGGTMITEFELEQLELTFGSEFLSQAYARDFDIGLGTRVIRDLDDYCMLTRGRLIRPVVCIDDRTAFGIQDLMAFPADEIFRVEVIHHGQMIRLYTGWFMEDVASGRARLVGSISPAFC